MEYDYELVHRRRTQNINANALSMIGSIHKVRDLSGVPNEIKRKEILYEFHDSPVGGHKGMNKTYHAIKAHDTWLNMRPEVEEHVKLCKNCQINRF